MSDVKNPKNQKLQKQVKDISDHLSCISKDLQSLKKSMIDIKGDLTKLNMIEEKIKKGEHDSKYNNGWFWWVKEMPT